jgi:hypothetical protein
MTLNLIINLLKKVDLLAVIIFLDLEKAYNLIVHF